MNFKLYIAAAGSGPGTLAERPRAKKQDAQKDFVEIVRQQNDVSNEELKKILAMFDIRSGPIGKESSYGKIWDGVYKGMRVAIKTELRTSDSNELAILSDIKKLRESAPEEIKAHLPKIYHIGSGEYWNYYVMENLEEAPMEVKKDIFGTSEYIRKENDNDSISREIFLEPSKVNVNSASVSVSMGEDRWSDKNLFESAFNAWFDLYTDISDSKAENYRRTIYKDIFTILQKTHEYTPWIGPHKIPSLKEVAARIKTEIMSKLSDPDEKREWDFASGALPELLFAIAMAPRLSRWSPEHPEGHKYEKLRLQPSQEYHVTLQSTLDWLASHGLKWGDVHSGNIMIRPSTRDIVFIDFGLYAKATQHFRLLKI